MSNLIPFSDMEQMAKAMVASKLFGVKDVNEVIALGLVAQADGMPFASAVRDYDIILGRPALKSSAMQARFQAAGGKIEWQAYTDIECTGVFSHPNGGSLTLTWTIDQARSIGLVKPNSGWTKYPRAMLRARCLSEGIRTVFPGCLGNMYAPEEVQDFDEKPRAMRDITPPTTYAGTEAVALVDMVDDEVDVNTLKLYVPNQDEPYAKYLNIKDWQIGFLDMASRIYTSPKFDEATRIEKYTALKVANKEYMDTWDSMQTAELLGGLNRLNKELNNG